MQRIAITAAILVGLIAVSAGRGQEIIIGPMIERAGASQNAASQSIDTSDPSGAMRFLASPGELVTLYGPRRFDPYYEPGRQPPPTDPDTGWPLGGAFMPYSFVGGAFYSPYGYRYSPYDSGFYRSFYRPRYVPYGYGYGWGYRYPFGFQSWYAHRFRLSRPWNSYGLAPPWHSYQTHPWELPHFDHDPAFIDDAAVIAAPAEYGGCFYW